MDQDSSQFMALLNQPPGFYTPRPSGMITISHHQAGDLHTPLGFNLVAPISIPSTFSDGFPAGRNNDFYVNHFPTEQQQFISQHDNAFAQDTAFAPCAFMHQDSTYDPIYLPGGSPMYHMGVLGAQPMNPIIPRAGFSNQREGSLETDREKLV